MKRIFLTSGIVVCMACPAFALSENLEGTGNECVIEDLGTATDGATVQVEAQWTANISGAITLDSDRYASSSDATAATTADTAAGVSPVYSKYATGIYSDSTATTPVTALSTQPAMYGYTFQGFYTGKAGTETPVVSGANAQTPYTYLEAAKTVVTDAGDTDTWYAHWTANSHNVTYDPGAHGVGAGRTIENGVVFDSTYTILGLGDATNASGVTQPDGYTFAGWQESLSGNATRQPNYTYNPYHYDGDLTLTALWNTNSYTISYLPGLAGSHTALENYVTGSTSSQTVTYDDEDFELATNGFSATGYHFVEWASEYDLENGNQTASAYGSGETIDQYRHPDNIALTAQWAPNVTTITYSCGATQENGITGSAPSQGSATYDANFAFAANLAQGGCAKTGWTFDGWTCKVSGAGDDVTLAATYGTSGDHATDTVQPAGGTPAAWLYEGATGGTLACTAHFTANTINVNWYYDADATETYEENTCTYDGNVTLPTQPEKTGYTFGGWKVGRTE